MNSQVRSLHTVQQQRQPAQPAVVQTTLYVFDTSVLLHDPTCLFRFQEHDIYLPLDVLEELDSFKKGTGELSLNAREVARFIDDIMTGQEKDLSKGFSLEGVSNGGATGRLFLNLTTHTKQKLDRAFSKDTADNRIITLVRTLKEKYRGRRVVIVTKDRWFRIKAVGFGLEVQDYRNDHAIADTDVLRSGIRVLPEDFWETHRTIKTVQEHGHHMYEMSGPALQDLRVNEALTLAGPRGESMMAVVRAVHGSVVTFSMITDYRKEKNAVWGVVARNREQCFALNLLMDPNINFVTMLGAAGTGKTLLALAAGLDQVLKAGLYSRVTVIKETMPVGKELGYFPGDEDEKLAPWLGAIRDNLEVLEANSVDKKGADKAEGTVTAGQLKLRAAIETKSLTTVRGRSFFRRYIVVDEAQNLTPKQAKTLITRAGPDTKVICMGNLAQIDTPYLTEESCGLSYLVNRMKDYPHGGHVVLVKCERSDLADYANTVL